MSFAIQTTKLQHQTPLIPLTFLFDLFLAISVFFFAHLNALFNEPENVFSSFSFSIITLILFYKWKLLYIIQ